MRSCFTKLQEFIGTVTFASLLMGDSEILIYGCWVGGGAGVGGRINGAHDNYSFNFDLLLEGEIRETKYPE